MNVFDFKDVKPLVKQDVERLLVEFQKKEGDQYFTDIGYNYTFTGIGYSTENAKVEQVLVNTSSFKILLTKTEEGGEINFEYHLLNQDLKTRVSLNSNKKEVKHETLKPQEFQEITNNLDQDFEEFQEMAKSQDQLTPQFCLFVTKKYKWCGPGCGYQTGGGTPINKVDKCCKNHDDCYGDIKTYPARCSCDLVAASCAKDNYWVSPVAASAVISSLTGKCGIKA